MREISLEKIKEILNEGRVNEAIILLNNLLDTQLQETDKIYYLMGNAYRKIGDWQGALNNYQKAIEANPNSPAKHARTMVIEVLDFYNKDMFNH